MEIPICASRNLIQRRENPLELVTSALQPNRGQPSTLAAKTGENIQRIFYGISRRSIDYYA